MIKNIEPFEENVILTSVAQDTGDKKFLHSSKLIFFVSPAAFQFVLKKIEHDAQKNINTRER